MFAKACSIARNWTRPMIVSVRLANGSVETQVGTYFIVNKDGWALSAGHLFDSFVKFQSDQKKMKEAADMNQAKPGSVEADPKWITNHSFWWGWDNVRIAEAYVNTDVDIALCKLDGFRPDMVTGYPIFKDPEKMRPGTSLCRTGFPFINDVTEFDDRTGGFRIKKGVLPMAFFPNEGIHTRNIFMGKSRDGGFDKLYVETSSPGIKGQSGGPIFDRNGCIAGMQVFTQHFALDFRPSAVNGKGETVEFNQFMNIGVGVHVKTIRQILDAKGVKYDTEGDDQGFRIIG